MKNFEQLKSILELIEKDIEKFYTKGNKSAGIRIRKSMQEIKKVAQEIRKEISERKKKRL